MENFDKCDAVDYLDNEETIAEYLTAALEDGNSDVVLAAIADVAKLYSLNATIASALKI
jgi:DNA-binding phage protein